MFETVINLKPKEEWRPGLTVDGLIQEMDRSLQFPGVSNAWTMPIKARIDMLSTGIRTPVGVKVIGKDLAEMEKVAREVETALKTVPGTVQRLCRAGGRWLLPRDRSRPRPAGPLRADDLGRAGRRGDGSRCRTDHHHCRGARTLHGRHPLSARPAFRSAIHRQGRAGVAAEWRHGAVGRGGRHPAHPRATSIRTENAKLATYIFVDIRDRDLGGYVADAQEGGGRTGEAAGRHLPHLERSVRIPANAPRLACKWWCR